MRALIVDDEPTVCLLLSRILARDFECQATEASNGIEALDLLSRERYDFMLLDLLMPIMSGLETLQTIRRDEHLQHLPVMVMSTVREEARVREAIQLGVGTYLTKPLRPADVATRLNKFVARLGAAGAIAAPTRSCLGVSPGARILVVDDDPDFRAFVHGVLSPDYAVAVAASGAQGLRMAMDSAPALIILGPQLGVVRLPVFLEKLRALPRLGAVPVVAAVSSRAAALPPGIDASIDRTFVAEGFRRQFDTLVRGAAAPVTIRRSVPAPRAGGTPEARPDVRPEVPPEVRPEPRPDARPAPRPDALASPRLEVLPTALPETLPEAVPTPVRLDARPHLLTVARQVMQSSMGVEVDENPSALVGAAGDHVVLVPLEMSQPAGTYLVRMRVEADVTLALAQRARRHVTVDEAMAVSALQDLAWTLASRLLGAMRVDGVRGELGLPELTTAAEPGTPTDGSTVTEVGFASTAGDVRFSLALQVAPAGATRP
ncbi:response regulator [Luteitalea sp.]